MNDSIIGDAFPTPEGRLRRAARKVLFRRKAPDPSRPAMEEQATHAVFIFLKRAHDISLEDFLRYLAGPMRARFAQAEPVLGYTVVKQFHSTPLDALLAAPYMASRNYPMSSLVSWAKGQPGPARYRIDYGPYAEAVIELHFAAPLDTTQRDQIRVIAEDLAKVCDRVTYMESDRRRRLLEAPETGKDVWLLETNVGLPGVSRQQVHDYWLNSHGHMVVDNRMTLGWAEYYQVMAAAATEDGLDDGIDGFAWVRFPSTKAYAAIAAKPAASRFNNELVADEVTFLQPVHGMVLRENKKVELSASPSTPASSGS